MLDLWTVNHGKQCMQQENDEQKETQCRKENIDEESG